MSRERNGSARVSGQVTRDRRDFLRALLGLGACACSPEQPEPAAASTPPTPAKQPPPPPPDPLGPLDELPVELRPAFALEGHDPPPAGLNMDGEPEQSYAQFLAERPPVRELGSQRVGLLPIGEFPNGFIVEYGAARLVRCPPLSLLARFVEAWFGLGVDLLPPMPDEQLETLPVREQQGRRQLDADAVLEWLRTQQSGPDYLLALTLRDLYTDDSQWVFGYASIGARVGVHSLLRYDPGLEDTDARGPAFRQRIRDRTLRVLAHEVAHMLGLRHCAHFRCIMNPTAGIADLDALPLHLCPVCLRKLWRATGVPLTQRWRKLREMCDELDLHSERDWIDARLQRMGIVD